MARPKSPNTNPNTKKTTELKPAVTATSPPQSSFTNGSATAAAPAMEASIETRAATIKATTKDETPIRTATRKIARKPELVKTEARANLVPISLEEEIRQLAYLFAERRGFQSGHETEDWLAAEAEVRQRYHQQSA
jgi:hypothetical protein